MCVCVCMHVCLCRKKKRKKGSSGDIQCVCVCVCEPFQPFLSLQSLLAMSVGPYVKLCIPVGNFILCSSGRVRAAFVQWAGGAAAPGSRLARYTLARSLW